jgi:hypothetical protein
VLREVALVAAMTASADAMVVVSYERPDSPAMVSLYGAVEASHERSTSGLGGGGIAVSLVRSQTWMEGLTGLYFVDLKAGFAGGSVDERPVEVAIRVGVQTYAKQSSGHFVARPYLPYAGGGVAVFVPGSKVGPTVVLGIERWFGSRAGVFAELELRWMFGGATAEQISANLGFRLRL